MAEGTPIGFWILDFGFWILDFGFWILDFGFWILDCAKRVGADALLKDRIRPDISTKEKSSGIAAQFYLPLVSLIK